MGDVAACAGLSPTGGGRAGGGGAVIPGAGAAGVAGAGAGCEAHPAAAARRTKEADPRLTLIAAAML
jgi:hypothetical protein